MATYAKRVQNGEKPLENEADKLLNGDDHVKPYDPYDLGDDLENIFAKK